MYNSSAQRPNAPTQNQHYTGIFLHCEGQHYNNTNAQTQYRHHLPTTFGKIAIATRSTGRTHAVNVTQTTTRRVERTSHAKRGQLITLARHNWKRWLHARALGRIKKRATGWYLQNKRCPRWLHFSVAGVEQIN